MLQMLKVLFIRDFEDEYLFYGAPVSSKSCQYFKDYDLRGFEHVQDDFTMILPRRLMKLIYLMYLFLLLSLLVLAGL